MLKIKDKYLFSTQDIIDLLKEDKLAYKYLYRKLIKKYKELENKKGAN